MTELSRSEQMLAEKTVCILLVRGENPDGEGIYAYVAVRADRLEEFMQAQKNGLFYPEDYGVIVESGIGEPTDEIRQKMEKEYGFNHQMMVDVPDSAKASEIRSDLVKAAASEEE